MLKMSKMPSTAGTVDSQTESDLGEGAVGGAMWGATVGRCWPVGVEVSNSRLAGLVRVWGFRELYFEYLDKYLQ